MLRPSFARCSGIGALIAIHCLPVPADATSLPRAGRPLMDTVAHRAFEFFWKESNPMSGLAKDRAHNLGAPDNFTVASVASTGYALAALPVGVQRGWVSRSAAYVRALTTLRFVREKLTSVHGFYYHFIDWRTGERVWKCELSSIDSALLVIGALAAGQYWPGTEVQTLANELYDRMDFPWMQGEGKDDWRPLTMGWKPESGFLQARWKGYSEASFLYLLALGSPSHPLPGEIWDRWRFPMGKVEGYTVFGGPTPLFMAQMPAGYYNLRGKRDRLGRDWWTNFVNAHRANHAYCTLNPLRFRTYSRTIWGITASDLPNGYGAQQPVNGKNDGTVAPTAALGVIVYEPSLADRSLQALWRQFRDRIWGRYGFSNALNVDAHWYDRDVIGIDLGMMLLAIENHRSGLIWRLMESHPAIRRGMLAAGFHPTGSGHKQERRHSRKSRYARGSGRIAILQDQRSRPFSRSRPTVSTCGGVDDRFRSAAR